jgi:hypothetical protein
MRLPGLEGDYAQIVEGSGVIGPLRQDLAIELLGLAQLPGTMPLDGLVEGVLQRDLGHTSNIRR